MSFIVAREFGRLLKLTPFASCRLNKHSSMTSKIVRAKLEGDERTDQLKQLQTTGWQVLDNRDALHKAFTFKNFNQAFGFMTRVALLAEKLDHHPEWSNVYNKVQVTLSTHDMNGLSTYDVQMAQFMDKCVASTMHNN